MTVYWEGLWTGMLLGSVLGAVAMVGAEVAVACFAYAGYRMLVRLKLLTVKTTRTKASRPEAA